MSEPTPTPSAGKVPDLLVEQLALGELDAATAASVRERLEQGGDTDALARIDASNREILADYPPDQIAAAIQRRAARDAEARSKTSSRGKLMWALAPAMVAAVTLVWVMTKDEAKTVAVVSQTSTGADTGIDTSGEEVTRIKGGVEPHLVIDRRTAAGHERLGAGDVVRQGDLLQVSYVPAGRKQGVIVSIDGAGAVTLHHPADPSASPTLSEGSEVPLAHSYELDDAPGFERFLFVTRDGSPPDVAEVMRAAERLAADPQRARSAELPLEGKGWTQHSQLLRKPSASAEGESPDGAPVPAGEEGPGGL